MIRWPIITANVYPCHAGEMNHKARKSALFVVFCWALRALRAEEPAAAPAANARPRIGLVLSGGGARGAAHIGVLKVLEENHIPVDAIAGTSMGAVVGGLYASGLSADEIRRVMNSVDWQEAFRDRPPRTDLNFRRKLEDQNFLVKFPLGIKGRKFRLPRGLVQGQKLTQILRDLTLPVAQIQNFDDLAIPFRAVATDIVTGERVVIDRGDLTTAMRASVSAPGVFSPVEFEGRLLVDGGLSSNLPIDVAREMGVDMLIVVDTGFPLLERQKLDSVATVSNQMLAILIRNNTKAQRKTLTADDIVIDPALGDFSSLDFNEHAKAMCIGEQAARGAVPRLRRCRFPSRIPRSSRRAARCAAALPRVDFLRVEPGSERYAGAIEALFGDQVGKVVNADKLDKRVNELYGQGNLETFDYRLVPGEEPADGRREPEFGLALTTRRNSWGPNYLRFGLQLQNDFEGNSSFNAAVRGTLAEITRYGGEWVWDLQVGETPRVATEVYLPVGISLALVRGAARRVPDPHAAHHRRERAHGRGVPRAHHRLRRGFRPRARQLRRDPRGLGPQFRRGALRVGEPIVAASNFDSRKFFGEFRYDTVDDVNFPRHGGQFSWAGRPSAKARA